MIKIYPPTKQGSKEMFDDFERGDFERKEAKENAQDDSTETEVEFALEEKLEAEAREQTEANEEFMELRAQEKIDYGPDDRHAND